MALINDYQRDNDPRKVINQIDDVAPIRPVVPLNAGEQEQLEQEVPEVMLDAEDPILNREHLDNNNELPVQPHTQQTVQSNLNDFMPVSPSQQIFPSISDIGQQVTDEALELQNQELIQAGQSFHSGMLSGTVYPTLYEVGNDISKLDSMVSKTNELVYSSVTDSINQVKRQLHNPIRTRVQSPTSRGDTTPTLDSTRTLGQNVAGTLSPIYNTLSRSFNDGSNELLSSTIDGDKFSPLKGFYTFADNVLKDPLSAVPSILNPIGGGVLGDSTFGEYGQGGLGAILYALDLTSNVPIAAATDLLNKIQNKETPNNQPNWLQALQGQDYSFSSVQKENGQNRLSVVAPLDTDITTWKELKDRSWANKFHPDILLAQGISGLLTGDFNKIPETPGNIVKGITEFVTGNEELAEAMPGRIIQAKEFMVGLGLDALTGDIFENAIKGGKRGLSKLFGRRASKNATERAAVSLATETPDMLAETPTIPTKGNSAVDDAVADFNAKVGEVEEVLSNNLEQTNLRPTLGGEAKKSDVVDSLTQAPLELDTNFVKRPATELSIPDMSFPSRAFTDDGLTRNTTSLLDSFGTNPADFKIVTPETTDLIRRSNADLTNLAISRGDIPARSTPLSSRRLELLNEAHDGIYSRYGQRLDEFEIKVPKDIPDDAKVPMKVADNFADDIINPPTSNTAIIEFQNLRLPKSLVSRSEEGLNITKRLMRNTQVYDDLAGESAELQLKFSQELEAVTKSMERLEDLPDIGRRTLLESPDLPVEYIPNTTPPVNQIIPDEQLVSEINEMTLYHGTKSPGTDLTVVDPVKGAARSEMGVGLHLTTDENLALSYSAATPTRNLPSVETRKIEARGVINQYQPKVKAPVDVTKEVTPEISEVLIESIDSIPPTELNSIAKKILKNHVKKKTNLVEFFEKMDDVGQRYYLDDGIDYPEETILNLQRVVTQNLRSKLGIDALVYKTPDRMQVSLLGSPYGNSIETVGQLVTPSTIRTNAVTQATYRNNVDAVAAEMFPNSKYASVNAAESKVNLMTQMSQRTAEQLDALNPQLSSVADELARQESALRKQVMSEKGERLARKEKVWQKRNETQIKHWNKPEDGIC